MPAGDQGGARGHAARAARAAQVRMRRSIPPSARAMRASHVYARGAAAVRDGIRQPRVRHRGPLPRSALRRADGHQPLSAVGIERSAPAGVEVPLSRRIPAAPRSSSAEAGREIILCGDWNIAHQQIDLRNWRSNQKNSGFLPEERAWLTRVFDELGLRRRVPPGRPAPGAVHVVVEPRRGVGEERRLAHRLPDRHARHRREGARRRRSIKNRRFSDHAPLIIDYDHELTV